MEIEQRRKNSFCTYHCYWTEFSFLHIAHKWCSFNVWASRTNLPDTVASYCLDIHLRSFCGRWTAFVKELFFRTEKRLRNQLWMDSGSFVCSVYKQFEKFWILPGTLWLRDSCVKFVKTSLAFTLSFAVAAWQVFSFCYLKIFVWLCHTDMPWNISVCLQWSKNDSHYIKCFPN